MSQVTQLLLLDQLTNTNLEQVGGKAINLGKLLTADFPVPPGLVITTQAYHNHIQTPAIKNKLQNLLANLDTTDEEELQNISTKIKKLITTTPHRPGFAKTLNAQLKTLSKDYTWAVRSSATAEDLPEASFAGQQDTYLNITTNDVAPYVKSCWASYWNQRAISYRQQNNIDHLNGGVAVIVQHMVDATKSGVMFTSDPRNKRANTIILESIYGLGEAIVSGMVTPDQYAIDKKSGEIIKQNINTKEKKLVLAPGENKIKTVAKNQQNQPSLTPKQISQLVTLGKKIETHFQSPQDIEWSYQKNALYILQTRPITTLEEPDEILWTRGYGDEYWTDVASPLYVSLLGHYLEDYVTKEGAKIMGYNEVLGHDLIRMHKSHAYFNTNVLESVFTYYPKFARTKELLNYFPLTEQDRIQKLPTKTMKLLASQIRIALFDPDGKMGRTDKAYTQWCKQFLADMEEFDQADLSTYTNEELHLTFQKMEHSYLKHYRLIRYGMVSHSIATNLIIKKWLESWLDDKNGELYSKIISGLPGNKTVETNTAIAQLASLAQQHPTIKASLQKDKPKTFLTKLKHNTSWQDFNTAYQAFLKDYGHRCHTREVYYPCWIDNQEQLIIILKSLIDNQDLDFLELETQKRQERLQTEQHIYTQIQHLRFGLLKKLIFKTVLNYAQTYLTFRENQRFYLDHQHLRQRRLFLEYGRRFHEQKLIKEQNDIFFLSKEDIFEIAAAKKEIDLQQLTTKKDDFFKNQGILPPKFIQGNTEFDDTVIHDEDSLTITGVGCSPGITTGTVRIIKDVTELGKIKNNDILITRNTDPAWTPIFKKLSGLITETGGILSHGAVVSREYGIPAVTAVKNATTLFKNGQTITLDGNQGIIYQQKKPAKK